MKAKCRRPCRSETRGEISSRRRTRHEQKAVLKLYFLRLVNSDKHSLIDIFLYFLQIKNKIVNEKPNYRLNFSQTGREFYHVRVWDELHIDLHISFHVSFKIQLVAIVTVLLELNGCLYSNLHDTKVTRGRHPGVYDSVTRVFATRGYSFRSRFSIYLCCSRRMS